MAALQPKKLHDVDSATETLLESVVTYCHQDYVQLLNDYKDIFFHRCISDVISVWYW